MSRPRMVTRTFTRTLVNFLAFDEAKNVGRKDKYILVGNFSSDAEILKALREQYGGPAVPIKVISHKTDTCLMGMYELEFYKAAVEIVDPNSNKVKETKKQTTKTKAEKKGKR